MSESQKRIAVLIDADNAPASKIDVILSELAKYGVANIRRAYGNWKSPSLKRWEDVLHDYAIRPMQQFDYTKGKNATDAAMIIDAMDLLYEHELDGFGIVSSDSDFTPLVMRLRTSGAEVYGFGEQKTPKPFVNACSKFLFLENLGQESEPEPVKVEDAVSEQKPVKAMTSAKPAVAKKVDPPARKDTNALKGDTQLVALLRNSVEATAGEDGWSSLSAIGIQIGRQASFDQRNYGYARLGDLIKAIDLFEIKLRNSTKYVRDKRAAKSSNSARTAKAAAEPSAPVAPPGTPAQVPAGANQPK
ncbi:MAG: NYN domain-containing protein [Stenotrophobium sp.]